MFGIFKELESQANQAQKKIASALNHYSWISMCRYRCNCVVLAPFRSESSILKIDDIDLYKASLFYSDQE